MVGSSQLLPVSHGFGAVTPASGLRPRPVNFDVLLARRIRRRKSTRGGFPGAGGFGVVFASTAEAVSIGRSCRNRTPNASCPHA